MPREGGLGRGLSSLIPQRSSADENESNYTGFEKEKNNSGKQNAPAEKTSAKKAKNKAPEKNDTNTETENNGILQIPVNNIKPNPFQPRTDFNSEKLQELSSSIQKHGILQPLVVTETEDGAYELVAGERRLEAAKSAGFEKVPAVVKKLDNKGKMELALIENLQRHNLNPIEEAKAYEKLKSEFDYTQADIAGQVGKSRSVIANALRLLDLPREIRDALVQEKISEGHARTLAGIENPEKQKSVFQQIVAKSLTVRDTERLAGEVEVSSYKRRVNQADPDTKRKEEELEEVLGTKVKIKNKRKGGQFIIEYYSKEEFSDLFNKLTS
ncbi:MAG: ParB/RepB/Spo0J family partition protein [Candidatus Moranbacteria bacterium]|nr:ParB/RepB/Spo0J family partition protein [Candidatus Moranbacteria bacterium]